MSVTIKNIRGQEYEVLHGKTAINLFDRFLGTVEGEGTDFGVVVEDILDHYYNEKGITTKALNNPAFKNFPFADLVTKKEVDSKDVIYSVKTSARPGVAEATFKWDTLPQGFSASLKATQAAAGRGLYYGGIIATIDSEKTDDLEYKGFVLKVEKLTPKSTAPFVERLQNPRTSRAAAQRVPKLDKDGNIIQKNGRPVMIPNPVFGWKINNWPYANNILNPSATDLDKTLDFFASSKDTKQANHPKKNAASVTGITSFNEKMLLDQGEIEEPVYLLIGRYDDPDDFDNYDSLGDVEKIQSTFRKKLSSVIDPSVTRDAEQKAAIDLHTRMRTSGKLSSPELQPGKRSDQFVTASADLVTYFDNRMKEFRRNINKSSRINLRGKDPLAITEIAAASREAQKAVQMLQGTITTSGADIMSMVEILAEAQANLIKLQQSGGFTQKQLRSLSPEAEKFLKEGIKKIAAEFLLEFSIKSPNHAAILIIEKAFDQIEKATSTQDIVNTLENLVVVINEAVSKIKTLSSDNVLIFPGSSATTQPPQAQLTRRAAESRIYETILIELLKLN